MAQTLEKNLRHVRFRCALNRLLHYTAWTITALGLLAVLAFLADRLLAFHTVQLPTIVIAILVAFLILMLYWVRRLPNQMDAALLIDQKLALQERFSTAVALAEISNPFAQAACEQAHQIAQQVTPAKHFPIRPQRNWYLAGTTWLAVLIIALSVPQLDLLNRAQAGQQQQQQQQQREQIETQVAQTTAAVQQSLEQLAESNSNITLPDLDQLAQAPTAEEMQVQAIRELGELAESLREMQEQGRLASLQNTQEMLSNLRPATEEPTRQLTQALAQGDFQQARQIVQQMQQQLESESPDSEQTQALNQQFQNLAQQLDQIAQQQQQELAQELQNQGLDPQLAQSTPQQLQQALQQQGLSQEQIEQLTQRAEQCQNSCRSCQGLSSALRGACSGGGMGQLADQLSALEAAQLDAQALQAALDELDQTISCLGCSQCKGRGCSACRSQWRPGLGMGQSLGSGGPGRGYGPRPTDEAGKTNTQTTRVSNQSDQSGPIIATSYFYDQQERGESQQQVAPIAQAATEAAAEAIEQEQIPRRYQDSVRQYFNQFNQSATQPTNTEQ